ncbi:MAG: DUF3791 domain-containing protein [Lachnospiraceae bacterium]|nr:DUF3791 domain-containing protein [Lachnospiraceae bacterium]
MPKEMDFFVFLLEQYAEYKNRTADKILRQWDELGLTDTIYNMYERYHIEAIENAFDDIDKMILNSEMLNGSFTKDDAKA